MTAFLLVAKSMIFHLILFPICPTYQESY